MNSISRILNVDFASNLLENSPNPIMVINPDTSLKYVNPMHETLTGYAPSEVIGKKAPYLWWTDDPESGKLEDLKRNIHIGSQRLERVFQKKSGERFWVELTSTPIFHHGEFGYALTTWVDITDRKKSMEENKILQGQLLQAQKMEAVGTLSGGIAHDFNNILSIILGNAELALEEVDKHHPARAHLEEVKAASFRAKDVVRQLLSFSRQTDQERKPIKIIPIIKESLKLLRSSFPTSIEIRQNIPNESAAILADPTQIHQVLINLCTNASHAMSDAGGVLEVGLYDLSPDGDSAPQVDGQRRGPHLKLTVSDTGQGISPEVIERIFDPYFTTKEIGKGTGMGLAVVHGIVQRCGGSISVESEPGKGTTFSLLFPTIEKTEAPKADHSEVLPRGHERILFVDDEEAIVKLCGQMLERLGYQVKTLTNAVDAFERFREDPEQFDLVFTDMTMPHMTGDKLAQKIKNLREDIPVMIATGFNENLNEEKARELGVGALVAKPLVLQELAETVREVLDGHKKV